MPPIDKAKIVNNHCEFELAESTCEVGISTETTHSKSQGSFALGSNRKTETDLVNEEGVDPLAGRKCIGEFPVYLEIGMRYLQHWRFNFANKPIAVNL